MFNVNPGTRSSKQYRLLSFLMASIALLLLVRLTSSPGTRTVYADSSTSSTVLILASSAALLVSRLSPARTAIRQRTSVSIGVISSAKIEANIPIFSQKNPL